MEAKTPQRTIPASDRYASGGPGEDLVAPNLVRAFLTTANGRAGDIAIRDPARSVELTWTELRDHAGRIAGGLAKLGVGVGDTVALMLNNRWELIPLDLGAVALGAVPFSIYQTSSAEQIAYLVPRAGSTRATSASSTATATCGSSIARRS